MGKKLRRGFYWRNETIWIRTDPVTGKAASTGCHGAASAYAWRDQRERLTLDPRHAAAAKATVGDWVKRTLAHKATRRSEGTLHMYGIKLGHVVRIFGENTSLDEIQAEPLDQYLAQRKKEGVKDNTISRELTCLRQMLRLAKRAGAYRHDLAEVMPVDFSPGYKPVTRTLPAADLPLLMLALKSDEERAWVSLALAVAADVGDVERARAEDYDPVRGVMRVRGTKTGTRDAEIPILEQVRPLLEYALPFMPLSWPDVSHALGLRCKKAGLPHLSPKDLRRSICSWLIASGVPQSLVSRFMRHKSDAMVRAVYGQMTPEELGSLMAKSVTSALQQHARPLGGTADAGDLKDADTLYSAGSSGVSLVTTGRESTRVDATNVSKSLHGLPALSLAYAAESLLRPLAKLGPAQPGLSALGGAS